MSIAKQTENAISTIRSGGIIAYPTESVYGLGCDPFNREAVVKILQLKGRLQEKGLIIIASHVQQILPLIQPINPNDLARALKTWPGHQTWVFPKSSLVPSWISGKFDTIAVRVSAHPVVKALCDNLNIPLVSTSANSANQAVLSSIKDIEMQFGDKIDAFINAPLGKHSKPSKITVAHTLKQLR
jgi:L-threonylcarbamoyladenylate synthase